MTREEQIKRAAEQFADREHGAMRNVSVFNLLQYAFKCGAEWAYCGHKIVWHPASEEPQEYPILYEDELSNLWLEHSLKDYVDGWTECVEFNDIRQWIYISDLLPKQ